MQQVRNGTLEVAAAEAVLGVFPAAMLNMIRSTVVYLLFVDADSALTVHASVVGIVARNKSAYCFLYPPPLQETFRFDRMMSEISRPSAT